MLVVSDTHLSPNAPEASANWSAIAGVAREFGMVIHAGDLTLDGSSGADDLEYARRLLDSLPVPWFAIPGNHDIRDNPGTTGDPLADEVRLNRWRTLIGPDHWTETVGGWWLVGINAQLFGSDLGAEEEQWAWLEDCFSPGTDSFRSRPQSG